MGIGNIHPGLKFFLILIMSMKKIAILSFLFVAALSGCQKVETAFTQMRTRSYEASLEQCDADVKTVMQEVLANCKKVEDDCEIYL